MATKTISSRVDEDQLTFAESLTRQAYGQSFGQYIASTLIPEIELSGHLPEFDHVDRDNKQNQALEFIRTFPDTVRDLEIGLMTDEEIKDLVASRYE